MNTIEKATTKKVTALPEAIAEEYKKLVLQKTQAGLDPELAERSARVQMAQDHGEAEASAALQGVSIAHPPDPYSSMADQQAI